MAKKFHVFAKIRENQKGCVRISGASDLEHRLPLIAAAIAELVERVLL
jgi:hypothetical protein